MGGLATEYILQETELHFVVQEDYWIEQDREGKESEEKKENEEDIILVEFRNCSEKVLLPSIIDKRIVALSDTLSFSDKTEEIVILHGVKRIDTGIFSKKKN